MRHTRRMGGRDDPERIVEPQRAGVRARLTGNGITTETADRWLDAWVLEATGRELPEGGRYWQAGWDWIADARAARRPADRPGRDDYGRSTRSSSSVAPCRAVRVGRGWASSWPKSRR